MGTSLLDRAKEVMKGAGVATALVIAPLGVATEAKADSVFCTTPSIFNGISGGMMGNIGQMRFAGKNGVFLTGDTKIDGLISGNDPAKLYGGDATGNVSAAHVAENGSHVVYNWGQDYDGVHPQSLHGNVGPNTFLTVGHDFSIATPDSAIPVSWTLTAYIFMEGQDPYKYTIESSDPVSSVGNFSGADTMLLPEGDLLSWSVQLDIDWHLDIVTDDEDPHKGEFRNMDDQFKRLVVDIPLGTSEDNGMRISIASLGENAPPAAPLPATAWTTGSLLGMMGLARLRKSRR